MEKLNRIISVLLLNLIFWYLSLFILHQHKHVIQGWRAFLRKICNSTIWALKYNVLKKHCWAWFWFKPWRGEFLNKRVGRTGIVPGETRLVISWRSTCTWLILTFKSTVFLTLLIELYVIVAFYDTIIRAFIILIWYTFRWNHQWCA